MEATRSVERMVIETYLDGEQKFRFSALGASQGLRYVFMSFTIFFLKSICAMIIVFSASKVMTCTNRTDLAHLYRQQLYLLTHTVKRLLVSLLHCESSACATPLSATQLLSADVSCRLLGSDASVGLRIK